MKKIIFKTESNYDKILELLSQEGPQRPEVIEKKIGCAHGTLFDNLKKLREDQLITRDEKKVKDKKDRERPLPFYSLTIEGRKYIYRKLGLHEHDFIIMRMKFREKSQFVNDFFKNHEIDELIIPDLIESFLRVELHPEFSNYKEDLCLAIYYIKINSIQNYPKYLSLKELLSKFNVEVDSPQAKRIEYYISILQDQFEFEKIMLDDKIFHLDLNDEFGNLILAVLNKVIAHETILSEVDPTYNFNLQKILSKTSERVFKRFSILEIDLQKSSDFEYVLEKYIKKVSPKSCIDTEIEKAKLFEKTPLKLQKIIYLHLFPEHEKAKLKYNMLTSELKIPEDLIFEDLHQIPFETFNLTEEITDIEEDIKKCKEQLKINPKDDQKNLLLSILYYRKENYQAAFEQINEIEIIEISPRNQAEVLLFKASLTFWMGNYEKSLELYEEALKLKFYEPFIWCEMGVTRVGMGVTRGLGQKNWCEALKCFENALKYKSDASTFADARTYHFMGITYYNLHNFEKALEFFELKFKNKPAKVYFDLSIVIISCLALKDYNKALEYFKEAIVLYPDDKEIQRYGGIIYQNLKKDEKALEYYQRALNISDVPEDLEKWRDILMRIVDIYLKQKSYEEALVYIDKALSIVPEEGFLWFRKGEIHLLLGESEKAEECFLKLLDPVHSLLPNELRIKIMDHIWSKKGHMLYMAGNLKKALECYQQSIEFNPNNIFVWKIMGNIYYSQGEKELAIKCFKKVLDINPKNERIKKIIQEVEKGKYEPPQRSYSDFS